MPGLGSQNMQSLACPSLVGDYTFSNQNVTKIVNATLQPASGWQDLSRRLALLDDTGYWSSEHIANNLTQDGGSISNCINNYAILQLVPQVCDIVYGDQIPDVTGLGVFVGYTSQIWLNIIVFAILPLFRRLCFGKAPKSFVGNVGTKSQASTPSLVVICSYIARAVPAPRLLQGYYSLLTITLTTNLIYAAWNSAASIHELTERPTLSTHWYLHDSNIVIFCMASLTTLISAFLLYDWEEYVSSMLINVILWIVVLGLFARTMVIDNRVPEQRMLSVAAACLKTHHEMAIPGIELSDLSTTIWQSSTKFLKTLIWGPVAIGAMVGLFFLVAATAALITTPLRCINNVSIKQHLTHLLYRMLRSVPASKPVNKTTQTTATSQNSDPEGQRDKHKTAAQNWKLAGVALSTLVLLAWAITSTILLHKTRKQIMQVVGSHEDQWLFGQYGAVILWIPIALEAIRIFVALVIVSAFDTHQSDIAEEYHELDPDGSAGSVPVHTATGSQIEQVIPESPNLIGRAF